MTKLVNVTDALGVPIAMPGVGTTMEQETVKRDADVDAARNAATGAYNAMVLSVDRYTGQAPVPGQLLQDVHTDPTTDIKGMGENL